MVTAEMALALPAVVIVLAVVMAAFTAAVDQLLCIDAARAAARAAARGDSSAHVRDIALRGAPESATVSVSGSAQVTVTVTAPPRGLSGWVTGLTPRASATSIRESGWSDGPT